MFEVLYSKRFVAGTLAWIIMILGLHFKWTPEFEALLVASGTTIAGLLILGYTIEEIAARSVERAIAITKATPSLVDDELLDRALTILSAVGVVSKTDNPDLPYEVHTDKIQKLYEKFLDRSR